MGDPAFSDEVIFTFNKKLKLFWNNKIIIILFEVSKTC